MEFEEVRVEVDKAAYERLSKEDIDRMVACGKLHHIEIRGDKVVMISYRPKTCRYMIIHEIFLPYRYI